MILIGYIRVSGERQKSNLSLPLQGEEIQKWCISNGHQLLRIEQDVESASSTDGRDGLKRALGDIFIDNADGIVVYKHDRFCRSVIDSEHLKRKFKERGKSLLSVVDPVDWETDDGEMLYQFKSVFAEYERKQIRRRCYTGQMRKRDMGGYAGGHPPYGYDVYKGTLIKNEFEQRVWSCIIELRESWMEFYKIAEYLNASGSTTKRGKRWTGQSVSALYRRRPNIKLQLPA